MRPTGVIRNHAPFSGPTASRVTRGIGRASCTTYMQAR